MARKPETNVGPVRIRVRDDRLHSAEYVDADLATDKEEREAFFGEKFVKKFNLERPLGSESTIDSYIQNSTDNLDFSIECKIANYLELTEFTPRNTEFGERAFRDGTIDVYEACKWILEKLLKNKEKKYGEKSINTLLLIYSVHWQYYPNDDLIDCLRSTIQNKGSLFKGIFFMNTSVSGPQLLYTIKPHCKRLPTPRHFRGRSYVNMDPMRIGTSG